MEQKEDILKNIPLVFDFIYTKIIGSTNPLTFFTVMSPGKYLEAVVISSCYICLHRHTHEYSSSFLVSLAVQSNSEVPQSSVLVPFKICMCEIKKSGNVNRPLMAHSVLEGEAGEC